MTGARRKIVTIALLGAVWSSAPADALSRTFHVSPFGSSTPPFDTYPKAAINPRSAIDSAGGFGDTVLIHSGSYDIDTTIDLPRGLALLGVGADSVSLVSRNFREYETMIRSGGDNEIAELTVENELLASQLIVQGFVLHNAPGDVAIHHCRIVQVECFGTPDGALSFHDNHYEVGSGQGIRTTGGMSARVFRNRFVRGEFGSDPICILAFGSNIEVYDNIFDLSGRDDAGEVFSVNESSSSILIVRNNLILGGIYAFNWRFHAGAIENNTVVGTYDPVRILHDALPNPRIVTIRSNAFVDFQLAPFLTSCQACVPGASIVYVNNSLWPPVDSLWRRGGYLDKLTIVDSGNIIGFPMFTSDSTYRLQHGSPLIDRGDPSFLDKDASRSDVGWTGGPGGHSYEYPDEPPGSPDTVRVEGDSCVVGVVWTRRHEADLREYRIYRGHQSGFWLPGLLPLRVTDPGTTAIEDTLRDQAPSWFYVITAVDSSDSEGPPSVEVSYAAPDCPPDTDSVRVAEPRISRVYPNPVRSAGTIEIEIPTQRAGSTPVEVALYDIAGGFVGTAFSGSLRPGSTQIDWLPVSTSGGRLASGIYLMHLKVAGRFVGPIMKVALIN